MLRPRLPSYDVAEWQRWPFHERVRAVCQSWAIDGYGTPLLGGALESLVPRAVDDIDRYEWLDGELVAGVVVGWNFGEGHLANRQLMRAVQAQCDFEPGELRLISVESQPIHRRDAAWWITDAATGEIASGRMPIDEMGAGQPWPDAAAPPAAPAALP